MDHQPLRKRRPESVRFPISPPDMSNDTRPSFRPISDSGRVRTSANPDSAAQNIDTSSSNVEEHIAQPSKLQLRHSRFGGLPLAPRNITPTSGALTLMNNNELSSPDVMNLSPSEIALDSKMRRVSNDLGILQEISNGNSSLGRKRSRRQEASTVFHSSNNGPGIEGISRPNIDPGPTEATVAPVANVGPTVLANSSLPLRSDLLKTPHARNRIPRVATPQRPVGGDTDKYIEHLESQLAALQTRLMALNSPSTSKTQSAKLRAVTSESRSLRQEIAQWERKFHDRISEQVEQHDMVVGSLKTQIRSLQRELETSKERMTELALECADKDRHIIAAEGANYDLERRLEFMSELLATSPSKMHPPQDSLFDSRRISAPRPQPQGQFKVPGAHNRPTSIHRDEPIFIQNVGSSPESPTRKSVSYAWEDNPFDRSIVQAAASHKAAHSDAAISDTTLVEAAPISPSGRRSLGKLPQSDSDAKTRPTRRMRRFYTGSMGPRSLILPSASQAPSLTSSPPMSGRDTPLLTSHSETISDHSHQFGFKLPISPERPQLHVRSATWDDNEASTSKSRKNMPSHTPLPLPSPSRNSSCNRSILASAPPFLDADALTPLASQQNSAQSVVTRDISNGSVQGRNLFEELSRIKRISGSGKENAHFEPSGLMKHRLSASLELLPNSNDRKITDGSQPHAFELASCPSSELSLEPDDNFPIEIIAPESPPQPAEENPAPAGTEPQRIALNAQPAGIIDRLLAFVSRSLDVSTPSVSQVISNAWSIVTLSRPVLEFRWWLVRLLVGGLRKKRRLKLLASSTPAHGLGISSAPGLVMPNNTLDTTDDKNGQGHNRRAMVMKELRNAQGFLDNHDSDVNNTDGEPEARHIRFVPPRAEISRAHKRPLAKPVAWLKFSMTLVFAVGVAIKDGPASLFKADAHVCRCADDLDDGDG